MHGQTTLKCSMLIHTVIFTVILTCCSSVSG